MKLSRKLQKLQNEFLHTAVQEDNREARDFALQHGADPNHTGSDGSTILTWAARHSDFDTLDALEKTGRVDLNKSNNHGSTALSLAANKGAVHMVRTLLERGADPNRHLCTGLSPLIAALQPGNFEVVTLLLEHGAKVEHYSGINDWTTLEYAKHKCSQQIVELLQTYAA